MVINGISLLQAAPIKDMFLHKISEHGVSHGLAEVGYDIRLKQEVRFDPEHVYNYFDNDPARPRVAVANEEGECYYQNGRFALASAMEEFDMPQGLVGIVHDKSTWARQGLSVFNTVVEPGWKGHLTLELVFHGERELIIPAGAGIAQVVFHKLAVPAQYEGKYQNQADEPVGAKHG